MAAALVAGVAAIYGQTLHHHFVYLDDDVYLFANEHVRHGFSRAGLIWSFTQFHASNWHPLTWLSHMLDCQLFGTTPASAGFHHLVSVGLHAANAVLLYVALRLMTGAFLPSVLVAALFAVHPLRVESVAWAAERKDVLSGFFFMLTLVFYGLYARRPGIGRYLLVLAAVLLGLLSKPMLVTLPMVLLLLDVWPLRRASLGTTGPRRHAALPTASESAGVQSWPRLIVEKLPMLAAVVLVSALTFIAQRSGGAVMGADYITWPWRIVGTTLGYVTYLWKTLWPTGLAPFYIHPATIPTAHIASYWLPTVGALAVLLAITWLVVRGARERPYGLIGWLWYVGMLVPVIGLLQVGAQLWADRYAYLPTIGAYVMIAWALEEATAMRPRARKISIAIASVAVVGLAITAHAQVALWKDSRTLFEHAVRVTRDNWILENNLGAYLSVDEPASREAQRHLEESLRVKPGFTMAHVNLADVLVMQGANEDALRHYQFALAQQPDLVAAHLGLGRLLAREGRFDEARPHFETVMRLDSLNAEARAMLGMLLASAGDYRGARVHLDEALRLDPNSYLAENLLARWLATNPDESARDPQRALALARHAAAITRYGRGEILVTLAAAYAATGAFQEAERWERRAMELAAPSERAAYRERLKRYHDRVALTFGR